MPGRIVPVERSSDPETFARNVATAVFAWDTGAGFMPLDYTAVVMEVADPTGTEQAGLANDLSAYLPVREAWVDLRQYATTQHLEITDVFVPAAWAEAASVSASAPVRTREKSRFIHIPPQTR